MGNTSLMSLHVRDREVVVLLEPSIPGLHWYVLDLYGDWPRLVVGSPRGLGLLAAVILPEVIPPHPDVVPSTATVM